MLEFLKSKNAIKFRETRTQSGIFPPGRYYYYQYQFIVKSNVICINHAMKIICTIHNSFIYCKFRKRLLFTSVMLVKTYGSAVHGIDATTVTVETDVSRGLSLILWDYPITQ